jgi:hypothetical protein
MSVGKISTDQPLQAAYGPRHLSPVGLVCRGLRDCCLDPWLTQPRPGLIAPLGLVSNGYLLGNDVDVRLGQKVNGLDLQRH